MICSRIFFCCFLACFILNRGAFADDAEIAKNRETLAPEKLAEQQKGLATFSERNRNQQESLAPSLFDSSVGVAYYGKKGSGKSFPPARISSDWRNPEIELDPQEIEKIVKSTPEFIAAQGLPDLPNCKASDVRRVEIAQGSSRFDYLFYSFLDPEQRERGDKWDRMAIPYFVARDRENAEETEATMLMHFALQFGVKCLPTRMYFATGEDQRRFLEVREGESAWDVEANDG